MRSTLIGLAMLMGASLWSPPPSVADSGSDPLWRLLADDSAAGAGSRGHRSEAEFLWLNRFTPAMAPDKGVDLPEHGIVVGVGQDGGFDIESSGDRARQVYFGSVDFSDNFAFTGRVGSSSGAQFAGSEANVGVRFSTRAGEQVVISVEPSVSWAPDRNDRLRLDLRDDSTVNVGATATYELSERWYISGMAQIEQGVSGGMNGSLFLRDTSVIGGFLTGVRF